MNRDIHAGLFFLVLGGLTVLLARPYRLGSADDMGPGYFPAVLGIILAAVGVALAIVGALRGGDAITAVRIRPLASVLGAIVAFGLLLETAGLLVATPVAVILASAASTEFRLWEAAALGGVLVGLMTGVFVFGLGLPFRIW